LSLRSVLVHFWKNRKSPHAPGADDYGSR